MLHYSCDRCRRSINTADEIRYVLRIEVQLATGARQDTMLSDASLEELEQLLEEIGHPVDEQDSADSERTFDLCCQCYEKYITNPLALEPLLVDFSEN